MNKLTDEQLKAIEQEVKSTTENARGYILSLLEHIRAQEAEIKELHEAKEEATKLIMEDIGKISCNVVRIEKLTEENKELREALQESAHHLCQEIGAGQPRLDAALEAIAKLHEANKENQALKAKIAEMESAVPTLDGEWITTIPTEPGWYWYADKYDEDPRQAMVFSGKYIPGDEHSNKMHYALYPGVENDENWLDQDGCDYLNGRFFSAKIEEPELPKGGAR